MATKQKFRDKELVLSGRQTRLWSSHLARCQSPIEQMFLAAWLSLHERLATVAQSSDENLTLSVGTSLDGAETGANGIMSEDPSIDSLDVVLIQPQLEFYRPDFVFWRIVADPTGGDPFHATKVIVECDGHEFHERTKEQATRDKARDRNLQALGFQVFRFTGSEIFAQACKCALEVNHYLSESAYRAASERHKFPM